MKWSPQQDDALPSDNLRTLVCAGCRQEKPFAAFPPDRRKRNGLQSRCRYCINSWMKQHAAKNPAWMMLRRARTRARTKGFAFDITIEDLLPLPELCPVFGTPLRGAAFAQDPNAYSLDRIDNKQGYVRGNIVVMSYRANRLKNDATEADLEALLNWMRGAGAATRAAERVTVVVTQ